MGEVLHEAAVEVHEAEERHDVFELLRLRPVRNTGDLDGVHANDVACEDESDEFDLLDLENAFFGLEEQVVRLEGSREVAS